MPRTALLSRSTEFIEGISAVAVLTENRLGTREDAVARCCDCGCARFTMFAYFVSSSGIAQRMLITHEMPRLLLPILMFARRQPSCLYRNHVKFFMELNQPGNYISNVGLLLVGKTFVERYYADLLDFG